MNRVLFLHIGHHKTGTSTLQRLIFPHLTSVAYFPSSTPVAAALKRAIKKRPPEFWRQDGQKIFARLMAELNERGAAGSALISSENVSAHQIFASRRQKSSRHPLGLAAHLRECRTAAARAGLAGVKVIVGIRRQDQYLASRYATQGFLADEPGQADFERQTLEIIDPAKRYLVDGVWLDYKMTRDLIVDVLGVNGVLVLPLEQLGADRSGYFAALGGFLGEAIAIDGEAGFHENVRGVAPDIWRCGTSLRRDGQEVPLTVFERKIEDRLGRGFEIRLGPELKSKILAAYEDSNRRLAADIGIDLARYRYY